METHKTQTMNKMVDEGQKWCINCQKVIQIYMIGKYFKLMEKNGNQRSQNKYYINN